MAETTTISQALVSALIEWRDELIRSSTTISALSPADVLSRMQDICIDTRLRLADLPAVLGALHDDAIARDHSFRGGRGTTPFIVKGLVRTLNDAIGTLPTP